VEIDHFAMGLQRWRLGCSNGMSNSFYRFDAAKLTDILLELGTDQKSAPMHTFAMMLAMR
jgi:hypothetical protein